METPRVSVAMATYNGAAFLRAQLESIAGQTRTPDELIVSDDGSTDGTLQILRDFAKTAPFEVKIVGSDTNLGVLKNFEAAVVATTGDYVFLSDQDDVWHPEKLAEMLDILSVNPEVYCLICNAEFVDQNLKSYGKDKLSEIRNAGISIKEHVMGCCAVFRRPLVDLALPFDDNATAHDTWMVGLSDLLGVTNRMDKVLQVYRQHGGNVSAIPVNVQEAPSLRQRIAWIRTKVKKRFSSAGLLSEVKALRLQFSRCQERRVELETVFEPSALDQAEQGTGAKLARLESRLAIRNLPLWSRPAAIHRARKDGLGGSFKDTAKDLLFSARP